MCCQCSQLALWGSVLLAVVISRRFIEALDCCVNLLDYWSWFGSEVSHTTTVLTIDHGKTLNAKQKVKLTKNHWR